MSEIIKATSVVDLLDYITAILGIRPRRSIAVMPMQDNALGPVLRMDAPPAQAPASVVAEAIMPHFSHTIADGAVLVGYDVDPEAVQDLAEAITGQGLPVRQCVAVDGDHYSTSDGLDGQWNAGESVVGLEMSYQGVTRAPVPEIPEHAGLDAPDTLAEKARLIHMDRAAAIAEVRDLWDHVLTNHQSTEAQALTLTAALALPESRDRLIADTYSAGDGKGWEKVFTGDPAGPVDWTRVEAAQGVLRTLITGASDQDAAHLLATLGHTHWMQGEGSAAGKAIDRACTLDPESTYARLLSRLTTVPGGAPVARDPERARRPRSK